MKIENLPSLTRQQLLDLAAKKKIPVKQSLLKKQLVGAVRRGLKKIEKEKAKKASAAKKTRTPTKKTTAKKSVRKKSAKAKPRKSASKVKKSTAPAKTKTVKKPAKKKTHVKRKAVLLVAKHKPATQSGIPAAPMPPPEKTEEDQAAKFILGSREIHDESQAEAPPEPAQDYGDHHLVFLPRDPYWAYAYWELQSDQIDQALANLGHPHSVNWVLRVYSPPDTRHQPGAKYFDTPIDVTERKGYLHLSPPGASFIAELGVIAPSGNFARVAVSNAIALPLDRPSDSLDEEWMLSPEEISFHYSETLDEATGLYKRSRSPLGSSLSDNPTSPRPK